MTPKVLLPAHSSPMLKSPALITGFSLIAMAVIAGFAYGFVYNLIYVAGDPVLSRQALSDNFDVYSYGIIAWISIIILDVLVSIGIYALYNRTQKRLTFFTSLLRIVYTLFLILATYQLAMPLMDKNEIINGLYYMASFTEIWTYGLIIFGLHLIFLSRVCMQSNFTPNIISVLLFIGGLSYVVIESLKSFSPPFSSSLYALTATLESVLIIPMAISELAFSIWLIIKAVRLPHQSKP
jgi:hypothetical protein